MTRAEFDAAYARLRCRGVRITYNALRAEMGGGSRRDISRYMAELKADGTGTPGAFFGTALGTLQRHTASLEGRDAFPELVTILQQTVTALTESLPQHRRFLKERVGVQMALLYRIPTQEAIIQCRESVERLSRICKEQNSTLKPLVEPQSRSMEDRMVPTVGTVGD